MAALIGSGPMGGGGMWYRTLERQVESRLDLLIFLAWYRKRHPSPDDVGPEREEADDPAIRRQQAEALALLHR